MTRGLKTGLGLGLIGLLIVLALSWFFGQSSTETVTDTLEGEILPGSTFAIEVTDTDVKVEFADVETITIESTVTHGWLDTTYEFEETSDGITIGKSCGGWIPSQCEVSSVVTVPSDVSVRVDSTVGAVTLDGTMQFATVVTTEAPVAVSGQVGQSLDVTTVRGDIDIDAVADDDGYRVSATTRTGELDVPESNPLAAVMLMAQSEVGDIVIRFSEPEPQSPEPEDEAE